MSCQRVLSMLSGYVDSEVEDSQATLVEEHLDHCASCAQEFKQLQRMTEVLRSVTEIKPPDFLLEQIMAATVNRPTVWARLRTIIESTQSVPQGIRWAGAVIVVAGITVGIIFSHSDTRQATHRLVTPESPPGIAATQPSDTGVSVVEVTPPVRASQRKIRPTRSMEAPSGRAKHRAHVRVASKPVIKTEVASASPGNHPPTEVESLYRDDDTIHLESPAATPEPMQTAEATMPVGLDESGKPAATNGLLASNAQVDADAFKDLQQRIAARNRRKKHESYIEHVEDRKYSVELASIRF